MKTWLHRISYCAEASYPLLAQGYLTIGFSDLNSPGFINYLRSSSEAEGRRFFEDAFDKEWGCHPKSRFSLWKFIVDMKVGDWVIVPEQGFFSVFEITSDSPIGIEDVDASDLRAWGVRDGAPLALKDIDLGFARQVKPVEESISRALFADAALVSRMKVRITTADISDLHESVRRSINASRAKKPINLHATLLEELTENTLVAIRRELDDAKFEKLVAWYFNRIGANAVEQPAKNESGKEGDGDIIATFDAIRTIVYVQAKAHSGATDEWAAEQITAYRNQKEVMDDGYARIAWVVSTADAFTQECRDLAKTNKVLLFDGKEFVKLLLNAGIQKLDRAFNT